MSTNRNKPCPCGSGKRYKKCCAAPEPAEDVRTSWGGSPSSGADNVVDAKLRKAQLFYEKAIADVEAGHLDQAIESFKLALAIQPAAEVYFNLALIQERQGQLREAVDSLREALTINPGLAVAENLLAKLMLELKQYSEAESHFKKALALGLTGAEVHSGLALALKERGCFEEALTAVNRALALGPKEVTAHYNRGLILNELGDYRGAVASLEAALAINPNYAAANFNLGVVHRAAGRFSESISSFRRAVDLDPGLSSAYLAMVSVQQYQRSDSLVTELEELYSRSQVPPEEKIPLAFALAKIQEDAGNYDEAFDYMAAGNKLKRATFSYSIEETEADFQGIEELFSPSFVARMQGRGRDGQTPLFILGMPRSGTSLVEQILASHPDVFGAGELNDLGRILKRLTGTFQLSEIYRSVVSGDGPLLDRIGDEYLRALRKHSDTARLISDKMPQNFIYLGIIRLALPGAKIIHCRRNPLDNCLSIYKTHFAGEYKYAYDQRELGRYYRLYQGLMRHWRELFPDGIYDLDYESLVGNLEDETRNLLHFCKLPWHDECLNFYRTDRKVATASAAQVRRPIYDSSVQSWRRYEKHLGDLQESLTSW